jgi:hypothetical protein
MPAPILSQPRNFGIQLAPGAIVPGLPKVGLVPPADTTITRLAAETVVFGFTTVRFRTLGGACSVGWRAVLPGGETGVFEDDVLPEGLAEFSHLETQDPGAFVLVAAPPPAQVIRGYVELFNPLGCEIDPLRARFDFEIDAATVVTGDLLVGLSVDFTEITRGGGVGRVWTNRAGVAWTNAAGEQWRSA